MRIFGWIILLSGLVSLEVTLVFEMSNYRTVSVVSGLLSIIGTFFVVYGYYKLEKENL